MVPNFLDIPLLLGREEVVRIAPLSSLKIGRNPRQAEEPAGGISGGGPDDDRADEVRRIVGSAEAARLSLANSPQDLSDPVSPSSRDMKASHEIAVCYRLSSPCVFPDVFCDVLQVEIVAATVQKVVPKICEFLLDLVTATQANPRTDASLPALMLSILFIGGPSRVAVRPCWERCCAPERNRPLHPTATLAREGRRAPPVFHCRGRNSFRSHQRNAAEAIPGLG